MSTFIREQIEKRLAELRYDCGLQRLHLQNAFGRRWSGCQRRDPEKPDSWELYWENLQAAAQKERPEWVAKADKALADFIAEHRSTMGPDWVGNEHGRLCWSSFLGGCPIDQHYCQLEEKHEGAHADDQGAWPTDVTNEYEWQKLRERCLHPSLVQRGGKMICAICGK